MKKIPSLFVRDPANPSLVINEVNPTCAWFSRGMGIPTRMFDGLCCLIEDGVLYKRHEITEGVETPKSFRSADYDDPDCKHGWVELTTVAGDRLYRKAMKSGRCNKGMLLMDGIYELCGPSVAGNPERFTQDVLVRHGAQIYVVNPRSYEEVRGFLGSSDSEGIVWYHPDGVQRAKVRTTDFGLKRPTVQFDASAGGSGRRTMSNF